jgi:hypothetical protein
MCVVSVLRTTYALSRHVPSTHTTRCTQTTLFADAANNIHCEHGIHRLAVSTPQPHNRRRISIVLCSFIVGQPVTRIARSYAIDIKP